MKKIIFISLLILFITPAFFLFQKIGETSFMKASLSEQEEKILVTEEEYQKYSSLVDKIETLEKEIDSLNTNIEKQKDEFSKMINLVEKEIQKLIILASQKVSSKESCQENQININKALKEELKEIIHIGEVLAEEIIQKREKTQFSSLKDLLSVSGIGEVSLDSIIEQNLACVEKVEYEEKEEVLEKEEITEEEVKEEIEDSAEEILECEEDSININTAEKEELKLLTGIGPTYAERITGERPFSSLDDLTEVSGIGEVTLENIKEQGCAFIEEEIEEESSEELEIYPESLNFRILPEETDSQKIHVSEKVSKTSYDLQSWIEVEEKTDYFEVFVDSSDLEIGFYEETIVFEDKKEVSVYLEVFDNLLRNPYFKEWDNGQLLEWEQSNQASRSDEDALQFKHSFKGPYEDDQGFEYEQVGETTYHGEILVKGYGDIRIGILRPGYQQYNYSEWETINTEEWIKVNHKIVNEEEGNQGSFRIQHQRGEENTNLYVGAAWLSTEEVPSGWPY